MPNQRAPGISPRTIAIPDDLWHRAQEFAARAGTSVSAVVRVALIELLEGEQP